MPTQDLGRIKKGQDRKKKERKRTTLKHKYNKNRRRIKEELKKKMEGRI